MINAPAHTAEAPIYTVAKCLNELIVNKNLDDALENIVEWLAISLDIDRCYIFENRSNAGTPTLFKSFRQGKELGINDNSISELKEISFNINQFPELRNVIERRQSIKVSTNNIISPHLRTLLEKTGMKSLLLTPVFSAGSVWGFIGFGDTNNPRTWRNSEQELQSLASAIGGAIESKKFSEKLNEKNESFNAALSNLNEFIWEVNLLNNKINITGSTKNLGNLHEGEQEINLITWFEANVHSEDLQRVVSKYKAFLTKEDQATEQDVYRIMVAGTNTYAWILARRKLLKDKQGKAISLIGTTRDITDTERAEGEYNKQKDQFNFLVQSLGHVIFHIDKTGRCISLSDAWKDISGFEVNETLGNSFYNYFDDGIRNSNGNFGCVLKGCSDTVDLQIPLIKKNGQKIWVRLLAKNTKDAQGNVEGVFGSIENINDKYTTNLLVHESNEKLNTILNSSKEIILTINLDDNVIESVNEAISVLGYEPEDWIGLNYKNWTDSQRHKFHELMRLALRSELQVNNQRITFANKDNTKLIPFEFSTSIFTFKNSKYLLCVLRDITERIEYEKNIQRISNQLTHLINNIDDVYAIYDIKTAKYEFVSDNVSNLYNCSKSNFTSHGLVWTESIHVEDGSGVMKEIQEIIEKKHKGEFFYRVTTADGETKMLLEKITVGKDKEGAAEKLYIVKTDYTHIERAEQSLIETERKFKFISENISDFISIHDPDWNFTYASPSVRNILGYEPEEILGLGGFDLVHPDDIVRTLDDALEPIILEKKETQFRYRMKAKDGEFKWVETYSKPVVDAHGITRSIISSTRDVTDQVLAETMLKTSEERYRLLSENSNDVIAIVNLQGEFVYVSPSCNQVLGYTSQELVGRNAVETLTNDDLSKHIATVQVQAMIKDKESRKFIQRISTRNGEAKSLEIWIRPILKNNMVVSFQAASRDVTEREKLLVELEQALTKERELNELRSMFVSTASHQFRTPLTVIQSGVEIMELYLEDLPGEKQKRFQRQFDKIQGEVERLHYLMSDILLLGRANAARTPFVPQTADLVKFCKQIIEEKYNNVHDKERKVLFSVKGKYRPVDFDPKLIGHAVENIINNAYKYSEEGNLFMDVAFNDAEVKIDITDQGIGIPEEDLKNLFQPFYRATNTNEIEGTGLGLAIMKEFVDKHNGKIFISSILNKGTTISVILPIKQQTS